MGQLAAEDVTCGTAASWRRLKGARRACYYLHTHTPALGVIFSLMIVFHQYDTVIYQSLNTNSRHTYLCRGVIARLLGNHHQIEMYTLSSFSPKVRPVLR